MIKKLKKYKMKQQSEDKKQHWKPEQWV